MFCSACNNDVLTNESTTGVCPECLDRHTVQTCGACQKLISKEGWGVSQACRCEDCGNLFCFEHIAHMPYPENPDPDLVLCVNCYPTYLEA